MDNIRGMLLMIAAMAGFAMEDMFIKAASAYLPTGQILVILGFCGMCVFGAAAKASGASVLSRHFLHPAVIVRNVAEAVAALSFISAITLSDLSVASAILQAVPLVVTLGAALLLGADVGWRRWTAITVGLAGVLMIVRPGAAGFEPVSLLAVVAVFALAARDIATRRVPPGVPSLVLSSYGFGAAMPAGLFLIALSGGVWEPMDGGDALRLAAALLFGTSGYYALVGASRIGDIAFIAPFRYARLLFALIVGAVVFGERPDAWTLLGAAIIIASGLYTLARERLKAVRPPGGESPLSPPRRRR
ncbi:DMT family transporter [Tropicimonas sp. IMCC34011]|uniref:DMT family transporter n=1 Tax=Tropicimonas sp. IMCC34011 TaxID=2248759 RepID=UPI000E23824E|nr:DMT family transporter [Tropicimonas sp. IMCC34011]